MANEALRWIAHLLHGSAIPFAVCGGLAAIGYGSNRPLYDIDIFVPGERFPEVIAAGEKFISKPAGRYREQGWNVEYVQFTYAGTKIEIGNASGVQVCDHLTGEWADLVIDFDRCERSSVMGVEVTLMARSDLVAYKQRLGRAVDLEDVEAMAQDM